MSREVRLRCYAFEEDFDSEINARQRKHISSEFVEDILNTHRYEDNLDVANNLQVRYLHTIAFEHNDSTLEVILKEQKTYRNFDSWLVKCHIILKNTASALKHLHKRGLVHGYLSPSTIGSFINKWKLLEIGMAIPIGHAMNGSMRRSSPPEAVIMPAVKKERSNELKSSMKQKGTPNKKGSSHYSMNESVRSGTQYSSGVLEEQEKKQKKRFFPNLRSKSRSKLEPEHYVMENPKNSRKRLGIFIFSMQDMGLADYGWKPDNRLTNGGGILDRETDASLSDTLPSQIGQSTIASASQSAALTKISMQEEEIIRLKKALEEKDQEYRKQLALERMQFKKNEINMHKEMKEVKENGKANASRTMKRTKARFAPEKVMASPSWDIWSLGVIMARLILGETTYLPAFEESDEDFLEKSLDFNVSKLLVSY